MIRPTVATRRGRRRGTARAAGACAIVIALALVGCGSPQARVAPTENTTPGVSPTVDPDLDDAQAAMTAFKALIARRDLAFHLDQASTVIQRGQSTDVRSVLDVSGKDVRAAITAAGTTADLVIADRQTWARERGHPWQRGKKADDATIEGIVDPWQFLRPLDQLQFDGRVDGTPARYRFRATRAIPYQTRLLKSLNAPGSIDALELVLEADGTPVQYTFHASARPVSGGLADLAFDMTSTVELSRVGERISIKPPK